MDGITPFYHVRHCLEVPGRVDEVFTRWTAFEAYPGRIDGVESVFKAGPARYLFELTGSGGRTLVWDALITRLVPDQYVEWGSDSQSPIQCSGRARFRERPQAVRIDLEIEYGPAAGRMAGEAIRFLERMLSGGLAKGSGRLKELTVAGFAGP